MNIFSKYVKKTINWYHAKFGKKTSINSDVTELQPAKVVAKVEEKIRSIKPMVFGSISTGNPDFDNQFRDILRYRGSMTGVGIA